MRRCDNGERGKHERVASFEGGVDSAYQRRARVSRVQVAHGRDRASAFDALANRRLIFARLAVERWRVPVRRFWKRDVDVRVYDRLAPRYRARLDRDTPP